MPRSLVLSGGGRYADPWHPFAKTSARLADVLWSLGHRVEVTDFIADRVAGLPAFDLIDERYVGLRLAPGLVPLVTHRHDGRQYRLLWAREAGRSRVVADTLGHGVESYDSAGHRRLLTRAVEWLTESAS